MYLPRKCHQTGQWQGQCPVRPDQGMGRADWQCASKSLQLGDGMSSWQCTCCKTVHVTDISPKFFQVPQSAPFEDEGAGFGNVGPSNSRLVRAEIDEPIRKSNGLRKSNQYEAQVEKISPYAIVKAVNKLVPNLLRLLDKNRVFVAA